MHQGAGPHTEQLLKWFSAWSGPLLRWFSRDRGFRVHLAHSDFSAFLQIQVLVTEYLSNH